MDVGLGSGTNLSFLKSLKALKSLKSMKALKSLKTLKVLRLLKFGKYIDPLFRAFKRWLLRWIADTRLASEVHLQKGQGAQSDWRAKRSLPAKLEMLKKGFQHAKREYAVSFEEFERDHELEITNFEAIVDTAALGYLIAQFKPNASIWRLVLIAETLIFCILVTWLKATQQPWVICVAGALVDSLTRQTTIFLLVLGALLDLTRDPGFGMEMEADQAEKLRYYVLTLIIGLIDVKCYAFEDCNLGLQVLRQWDVLIDRQQATKLRAWPSPNPSNLLTLYQKGVLVKWAAARDLRISTFRTPTGQCILHSAMLKGEPEIVAWILYHHPELLTVCDDQRDSPVVIALKELAFTLLKHQKKPTEATAWKRAKLAEILLSDQIQCYRVPWSLPHFRALGDIAVPLLGELVQQLALALNLQPPAGFVRISKWSRYPGDIPDFLAECYIACRDVVDTPRSELGDATSARTFEALTAALEMPQTTITIPSNFFQSYPIYIVRIDARMNRLDGKMGQFAARAIAANKTLTYLDLRYNNIDDDGGVALAKALKKNESLTLVNEYTRDFLPSSGPKICHALRVNGTITALDVSNNRLGADAAQALTSPFDNANALNLTNCLEQHRHRERRVRAANTSGSRPNTASRPGTGKSGKGDLKAGADHGLGLVDVVQTPGLQAFDVSGCSVGQRAGLCGNQIFNPTSIHNLIGTTAACDIFTALRNPVARDIDLSFCGIGPAAGEEVARCLRRSTVQWSRLDLEGNDLGKDGVNPIMWALRLNCTLTELLLSNNGIGGDFGTDRDRRGHYGNSLQGAVEYNFTLKRLDLAHNDISHECATGLAYAMVENPSLVALNFEKNHLDATAAEALSDRLRRDAQIRYLNLRRNDVSWQGAIRLANALETNLGILHLDLGFNGVGSCGPIAGRALADMICKNAILRHLDLEGNDIGPDAGAAIAAALMRNNTLQFINMINNHLENETGEAFSAPRSRPSWTRR
ncbi:hypothetical protein JL722_12303 [Aureococcus anophagefferens]|nr:hypothetical protein JL722_12303 [Aureococcus anophagefferens]